MLFKRWFETQISDGHGYLDNYHMVGHGRTDVRIFRNMEDAAAVRTFQRWCERYKVVPDTPRAEYATATVYWRRIRTPRSIVLGARLDIKSMHYKNQVSCAESMVRNG
jgi:hypothetical protein